MPNGRVFVGTMFFDTDAEIDNWAKKGGSSVMISENSETLSHWQPPLSISTIQDKLGIVKFYQMAGENAKTAALDKLEQAKAMEQAGKLSDDIFNETGWLKGQYDPPKMEGHSTSMKMKQKKNGLKDCMF